MKISVLINSYNYADYVSACVQSVLAQTRLPDEIIVVDDGSTDGSVALIEQKFNHEPLVKIIAKSNNGQLSAFNAGFRKSSGDLIFFLDADDVYSEEYLTHAIEFYHRNPDCGFLYCAYEKFGRAHGVERAYSSDQDHGYSVLESLGFLYWRGGPTSTLSLRRSILEKILPLNLEGDWPLRADDCLVHGAGVVGAHKYFLAKPLVRYRVHDRNAWYEREISQADEVEWVYKMNRLVGTLVRDFGYYLSTLPEHVHAEFASAGSGRNIHELVRYLKIAARTHCGITWKIKHWACLIATYARMLIQGRNNWKARISNTDSGLSNG